MSGKVLREVKSDSDAAKELSRFSVEIIRNVILPNLGKIRVNCLLID